MSASIRVLSGARAGERHTLARDETRLGRHPDAELQFNPDIDVEVSAWHAAISRVGERWLLRDLGSRNGTYVNGHRIDAETELHPGDRIRLGPTGPELDFLADPPTVPATDSFPSPEKVGPAQTSATMPPERTESTTQRIRALVRRQTRTLRLLVVAAAGVLAASIIMFTLLAHRQQRAWQRERAALQQRTDSVLATSEATIRQLRGQVGGLAGALSRSRMQVADLSTQLRRAPTHSSDSMVVQALERRLQSVTAELSRQQLAASLNFGTIRNANQRAIAVIYVQFRDGQIASGTAFAVRPGGILITNRHVVAGPAGDQKPSRVAVQFAGSRQVWPARVLATDPVADLAVVKVENIMGSVPIVAGLDARPDTLARGSPVVLIGYPLGGRSDPSGDSASVPQPLLTAGILSDFNSGHIQVLGYGAAGASGSPILDRDGKVIGVLYGGTRRGHQQILLGAPSSAIIQLLDDLRP